MNGRRLVILSTALRVCLQITFAAGAAVTAFLWLILREWFSWYFWRDTRYYYACAVLFSLCGVCSLYILWRLISLLKTIGGRDPFVPSNVRGMRHIAVSAFIISASFTALLFFRVTLLTAVIAYVFLLAGFCCVVFAALFKRAVAYKAENDLTV